MLVVGVGSAAWLASRCCCAPRAAQPGAGRLPVRHLPAAAPSTFLLSAGVEGEGSAGDKAQQAQQQEGAEEGEAREDGEAPMEEDGQLEAGEWLVCFPFL